MFPRNPNYGPAGSTNVLEVVRSSMEGYWSLGLPVAEKTYLFRVPYCGFYVYGFYVPFLKKEGLFG